jgi:ABC-type branched-subunit amino acid transport system substrate-binding protein
MDDTALATEPSLEGTWFAAPSPNLRRDFTQKYMGTYGKPAPRLATLAYDATALAAVLAQRGIQQTGQPSFDHAAITNPNGFTGINGIFRFRSDGTAERGLAVLEFKHGQITVIDKAPRTFQQSQY